MTNLRISKMHDLIRAGYDYDYTTGKVLFIVTCGSVTKKFIDSVSERAMLIVGAFAEIKQNEDLQKTIFGVDESVTNFEPVCEKIFEWMLCVMDGKVLPVVRSIEKIDFSTPSACCVTFPLLETTIHSLLIYF